MRAGAIDLHVHGTGKHDTRGGERDILAMSRSLGRAGLAAFLPTVYPAPVAEMHRAMGEVRAAMARGAEPGSARILGVHLEGPFLNPARQGALDKDSLIVRPHMMDFRRLVDGFDDIIRIITIAPELPGALKIIEAASNLGIRVNMGHTDATYRQALDGKKAGATGVTHLFNAMRPLHHREPGLVGLALTDPELYVELIADGEHVSAEVVRMVFALKPRDRIIAVSDSVIGPHLREGVLQGSNITLGEGVRRLIMMGIPGSAVARAVRANPLAYLG